MKFKSILLLLVVSLVSVVLIACGGSNSVDESTSADNSEKNEGNNEDEEFVFKLSSYLSDSHLFSQEGEQFFMEKAQEYSNNRIKFEFYPANQLGEPQDSTNLVKNGVADMALFSPSYESEKIALSNAFLLPAVFESSAEATFSYWEVLSNPETEIYKNDMEKNDLIPIYAGVSPMYEFMTAKKPIDSVEALEGLKLRSAGGPQDYIIEGVGSIPVHTTTADQYVAIERGTVDGGLYPLPFQFTTGIFEVANYFTTNSNMTSFPGGLVMLKSKFDQLPEDIQEALLKAGEETVENIAKTMDQYNEEAKEKLEAEGLTPYTFTEDEIAKLREMAEPIINRWIDEMKKQNLPGDVAVDEMYEALDKVRNNN